MISKNGLYLSRLPLYCWSLRGRSVVLFSHPYRMAVYRNAAEALLDERKMQQLATDNDKVIVLSSLEITQTLLKLGPDGRIKP